jgi:3-oxoisoapionate decarboxylase
MRIGLDHYTITHRGLAPAAALEFALARGLEGIQFLEPASLDARLDPENLARFRGLADSLNLYLEVGIPCPNPIRRGRSEGRSVEPAEHARSLVAHLEAAACLGCRHVRAYCGDRHDRFRTDVRWAAQLAATLEVLRLLSPALKALNLRVAVETHADLTSGELLALVRALGPETAGVTLDTGNLVMRLDEPLEAVEQLAPWVVCTHVKDATLALTPRGLAWQARPLGSGILPLEQMLTALIAANPSLNLSIELHPRTYDLPIHDASWLAFFSALRPPSLAAIVHLAEQAEARYASGSLPRPEEIEAVPWPNRDLAWIDQSAAYLRRFRAKTCHV